VVDTLGARGQDDVDLAALGGLEEPRHLELGHLEQGEESHHHVELCRCISEKTLEGDPVPRAQKVDDLGDPLGHRNVLDLDVVGEVDLGSLDDPLERLEEIEEPELERGFLGALLGGGARTEGVSPEERPPAQALGGISIALVFEEPADELCPRVWLLFGLALLGFGRRVGKHHPRLDIGEGGSHLEVLARHVEVEGLHEVEVVQVLRGHEGDGDIQDIELVRPDDVEQEIERPLPLGKRDGVLPLGHGLKH